MAGRGLFTIIPDRGPRGLLGMMANLEENLGPTAVHMAVRRGWTGIGRAVKDNFLHIPVPKRQKPYPHSHIHNTRIPRRRPGYNRRSVKYRVTPARASNVPRAYLTVHKYTWNFLVHGTKKRWQLTTGKYVGFVPDRVFEGPFYQDSRRLFYQALNRVVSQRSIDDPMRRH